MLPGNLAALFSLGSRVGSGVANTVRGIKGIGKALQGYEDKKAKQQQKEFKASQKKFNAEQAAKKKADAIAAKQSQAQFKQDLPQIQQQLFENFGIKQPAPIVSGQPADFGGEGYRMSRIAEGMKPLTEKEKSTLPKVSRGQIKSAMKSTQAKKEADFQEAMQRKGEELKQSASPFETTRTDLPEVSSEQIQSAQKQTEERRKRFEEAMAQKKQEIAQNKFPKIKESEALPKWDKRTAKGDVRKKFRSLKNKKEPVNVRATTPEEERAQALKDLFGQK